MSDWDGKGQEVKKWTSAMFILKKVVNCLEIPVLPSSRKLPALGCPTQSSQALVSPAPEHTLCDVSLPLLMGGLLGVRPWLPA